MSAAHCEVVIEGPRGWTLGFLQGYVHGRGYEEGILDAEEEGFDCSTLRERLREIIRPSSESIHLLVPAGLRVEVLEAIRVAGRIGRRLEVRSERTVSGARFDFQVEVYSREHAREIRNAFEDLPPGVRLTEQTQFHEITEPDGRGVETYAPLHEYEWRGEGGVEGRLLPVLELYRRFRDEPLVRLKEARLLVQSTGQGCDAEDA